MMKKIGILIDMENGSIKESNFGMITLANKGGARLYAFVLGSISNEVSHTLAEYGIHFIYLNY